MKTEFLVQLDGAGSNTTTENNGQVKEDLVFVVGATNRPEELDDAARRRFIKRLYIPLPNASARMSMMENLLSKTPKHSLTHREMELVVRRTSGFSGADMKLLATEAAMGPIRSCPNIRTIALADVRPVDHNDYVNALTSVRPSVSPLDLSGYKEWNASFGSYQFTEAELGEDMTDADKE